MRWISWLNGLRCPALTRRSFQTRRIRHRRFSAVEQLEIRTLLAVVSWDGGGGDFNWDNALNWDTNGLPGAGDDVSIPDLPGNQIIVSQGNVSVNSLTSAESISLRSGSISLAGGSQIDAALSMSNASLTGSGSVTVNGLTTLSRNSYLAGSGVLNANGGLIVDATAGWVSVDRSVLNITGTVTHTGGAFYAGLGAVINLLPGSVWDMQAGAFFLLNPGARPTFNNQGTFIKSAGVPKSFSRREICRRERLVHFTSSRIGSPAV